MSYAWITIAAQLAQHPQGTRMRVDKNAVVHPVHAGLLTTIDVPRGQSADYRLTLSLDPRSWLHVSEFTDHFEVRRVDRVEAGAPRRISADQSGALLGLFIGLVLGGTLGAALAGAAVGAAAQAGTPRRPKEISERRERAGQRLREHLSSAKGRRR